MKPMSSHMLIPNTPELLDTLSTHHLLDGSMVEQKLWEEDSCETVMSHKATTLDPHENDILMGRGGKNNQHVGNEKLRCMARAVCDEYQRSSKKGKSQISRDLVHQVRGLDPPGRFLRKNPDRGDWEDVGDDVAREKASQALRDAVALQQEEDLERGDRQIGLPSLSERQRSSSAPTELSTDSNALRRRRRTVATAGGHDRRRRWSELHHETSEGHEESSRTPFLPPVTPASATAAKRRRYVRSASSTWPSSGDHQSQQPQHPYEAYLRQQQQQSSSNRQLSAGLPLQQLRPDAVVLSQAALVSGQGQSHQAPVDFDLFNGELLDTGDEGQQSAYHPHHGRYFP